VIYGDEADIISIYQGEKGVIEHYRFADGTVFSHAEIVARQGGVGSPSVLVRPQEITQDDEILILGGMRGDTITDGNEGDVMYIPGRGDDTLNLYLGSNYRYLFNLGDGDDRIDAGSTSGGEEIDDETIFFGEDITPESIKLTIIPHTFDNYNPWTGLTETVTVNDLLIRYGNRGDTILVDNGLGSGRIERYVFADGRSFGFEQFSNLRFTPYGGIVSGAAESGIDIIGTDTVISAVDFTLPEDMHDLTLIGDAAIDGTGNILDNRLSGNVAGNALYGSDGDDLLDGGVGDDLLEGGDGDDLLFGGGGDDTLDGGAGNDVYLFTEGDGTDTIVEIEGRDRIAFDGVDPDAVWIESVPESVSDSGDSLLIHYGDGDVISIMAGDAGLIDGFVFDYGLTYSLSEMFDRQDLVKVTGDDGDNILEGLAPGTVLTGGVGYDLLIGGSGETTYRYNIGDDWDYLVDLGGVDMIEFGAGINPDMVSFDYTEWGDYSPSFSVFVGDSGISIYQGESGVIENYRFADGTILGHAEILARQSGLDVPTSSADPLVIDRDWEILILGGPGSDQITDYGSSAAMYIPGAGADTLDVSDGADHRLLCCLGDGQDTILTGPATVDTLIFGDGIAPADLRFFIDSHSETTTVDGVTGDVMVRDLIIEYGGQGDSLRIIDGADANRIERIVFADGTTLDTLAILDTALPFNHAPVVASPVDLGRLPDAGRVTVTLEQLLGNAVDADGDSLNVVDLAVSSGGLSENGDGSWEYQPDSGFSGTVVFSYAVVDGMTSVPATAELLVPLSMDNIIQGDSANNRLSGTNGNDAIYGGDGNDRIFGRAGDDLLVGGAGRDALSGGSGNDTFLVEGSGSSYDYFSGGSGDDTIRGGSGDDLIRVNHFRGRLTVETIDGGEGLNILAGTSTRNIIDLSRTTLLNIDQINAGAGNDRVIGSSGDDMIVGGTGRDTLQGGSGDDSYLFNAGDGRDIIVNRDAAGFDRVVFGADITPTDVALLRRGRNLDISYGVDDQLTVKNFFTDASAQVDMIQLADGSLLSAADIDAIIQQMAGYAVQEGVSLNSFDSVRQNEGLMTLVANSWHAA
jgi:Ca2+-binding RTX toxin-like protein